MGIWNDKKTGSKKSVSIWKAIAATSKNQQGVNAMAAIRCHCEMDLKPYVLKTENVQYVAGKPATKYVLQNVVYLFDNLGILWNLLRKNSHVQLSKTEVPRNKLKRGPSSTAMRNCMIGVRSMD